MASISSTYTDPQDTFVWWIEGDRIAIATSKGDGDTTETGEGKLKAPQLSTTTSYQADGSTVNLTTEPVDATETVIDVDYGAGFTANDIIQINDEIIRIESISTNALTVTRGFRNTTATTHATDYTSLTTLDGAISSTGATSVPVDDASSLSVDDIIRVGSEAMRVTAISTNTLTVTRGWHGTTAATASDEDTVSKYDDNGSITEHDVVTSGVAISYYAEPDKLSSITGTIDLDNSLQPALIDYVKAKALMDAAASAIEPTLAQIKMVSAQQCMANYKECVRKYGMKKNDKVGGTRGIVPSDLR
tara:strand:+ start:2570 stop:3481 length:912 start_codon:yes stop_codon:yes gene_type:complete